MIEVSVNNATRTRYNQKELIRIAQTILKKEKATQTSLSIVMVGETRSRALNKQFKGKDAVASVLTFVLDKESAEIVLCPSYIKRKKEPQSYYLIHALGHVLGHVHDSERAHKKMRAFEITWLNHFHICHPIVSD